MAPNTHEVHLPKHLLFGKPPPLVLPPLDRLANTREVPELVLHKTGIREVNLLGQLLTLRQAIGSQQEWRGYVWGP